MAPAEKHASTESDSDAPLAKKRATTNSTPATSPGPSKPRNPVIDDLSARYPTVEKLEEHIKSLSRSALEALILSGAFPEATSELRHCVYCHKTFHASDNPLGNCVVEHFIRECKPIDEDVSEWQCCGQRWDNIDNDDWMESAEDMFPHCYVGCHWEEEITTDDEEEVEEHNQADYMVDSEPRIEKKPVWWRVWKSRGNTCEKMGCKENLAG
ncbi:uncharacterized protein LAJ45_10733 [Morchella importuna]|uniref:uncharacterized protein n=1 Tax=Morchella importuna TaxID=1174673 RepID=UPI001E8CCBBB|nr:uncharacterized protein LAJ45_10733 [Morchella importuna]KAH8145296.1 hypothetical protein LAJ45_10733 [Morchella importuna]